MIVASSLTQMVDYFGNDVRRINHALKVFGFTCSIAKKEGLSGEMLETAQLAAILHDIGIPAAEKKYQSSAGKYQEIEGPPIAREILENLGVKPNIIDRVCHLIGNHHSYTRIDGIDFQILVEADFLVNIDEDKMDIDSVVAIRKKYIRTPTAISLLDRMYLKTT